MDKSVIIIFILCLIAVSSCDTVENRKEKAEAIIKKELFETLPDYSSYELVSLELDTIPESWIGIPDIMEKVYEYDEAQTTYQRLASNVKLMESELKNQKIRMGKAFLSRVHIYEFIRINNEFEKQKKAISDAKQDCDIALEKADKAKENLFLTIHDCKSDKFAGWHASHKFRANNESGVSQLHNRHYYLSPDFKQIILEWDDEDERIPRLLSFTSSSCEEITDIEDKRNKQSAGIAGEAILPDGRKLTFKSDHTIPEMTAATWQKVEDAIVVYTGEGTSYWSLIDGYLYVGEYKDGECWNEEWNKEVECMVDVSFKPEPSKGQKLKSLQWYN